jgi:hypothetical protein
VQRAEVGSDLIWGHTRTRLAADLLSKVEWQLSKAQRPSKQAVQ